jgi:hypothetical protein
MRIKSHPAGGNERTDRTGSKGDKKPNSGRNGGINAWGFPAASDSFVFAFDGDLKCITTFE